MIRSILAMTLLACATSQVSALTAIQPLRVVRIELRVDDKNFPEMQQIYATPELKQYRAVKLADAATKIAGSFKPIHPFVDWTGQMNGPAHTVFIGMISEKDHQVSAQWTFYLPGNGINVSAPCIIYSQFQNSRHLQDPSKFGDDVVNAMSACAGAAGLDLDNLPPFHAKLRNVLKNFEIASHVDAEDDDHVYLPLAWTNFRPDDEKSLFRVDYWSDYNGKSTHGEMFLGQADRESPADKARVSTVPHVCDDHKAKFDSIVKDICHCTHMNAHNAARTYNGLLQTLQHGVTRASIYIEVYSRDYRSGLVDVPDSPLPKGRQ
jgi:hypothetical protein